MLEPDNNPNPRLMVDPPGWLRHLMRWQFDSVTEPGLAVWGQDRMWLIAAEIRPRAVKG